MTKEKKCQCHLAKNQKLCLTVIFHKMTLEQLFFYETGEVQ